MRRTTCQLETIAGALVVSNAFSEERERERERQELLYSTGTQEIIVFVLVTLALVVG